MGEEQEICGRTVAMIAAAAVVLDPRLADVWQLIWAEIDGDTGERNGVPLTALAGLIRLAYLQGYADATTEADPRAFFGELGVRDPSVSRPKATASRRGSARARRDSSDR